MDPDRLLREEDEGWRRLEAIRARVSADRIEEPTVTPDGWSPKDTLHHVAAWLDLCGEVLERIGAGSWSAEDEDAFAPVDDLNARQFAVGTTMGPDEVEASLQRARTRARRAFADLDDISPEAWSWFEESGPMHYAKHAHDLLAFVEGLTPDPQVGPLLQAETDAWLDLAGALDHLLESPETTDANGWSARDTMHHLAGWLDHASPAVAANGYWYEAGPPAPADLIDQMNAGFLAAASAVSAEEARVALERARARMREAFSSLVRPTDLATHGFTVATIEHYAEHRAAIGPALPEAGGARP